MTNIVFDTTPYAAAVFGPQRVDIPAGPLEVVIHLHCYPPASPLAGEPALMVWRRPTAAEATSPMPLVAEAGAPLDEREWEIAIRHATILEEVRRVCLEIENPTASDPRRNDAFRALCQKIGIDPDWRPAKGGEK